jgi:hypothetical protein
LGRALANGGYSIAMAKVAELEAERDRLREAIPVLEYVSRGRRFVDVEPYPDATARRVLGALEDR